MSVALEEYLNELHADAVRTEAVADALALLLSGDNARMAEVQSLAFALAGMVSRLQGGLDCVNRSKGGAA